MKRCPECRRDYYDDTLLYCLEDGVALVQGAVPSPDEPATQILHETEAPAEAVTRAHVNRTEQTAVLPSGVANVSKSKGFDSRLVASSFVLAILVFAGFLGYRYLNGSENGQIRSIAVLPFENRSGDPDSEYLSDGLPETLIYRLSQLPNLKVSPVSSVVRYKGKDTDIGVISSELDVDAVMSGRLVQRGENLTISVDLIDAKTRKLIWGEQYERKLSELLATQRDIATEIAQKLELKLSGADEQKLVKKYTESDEAYQLYLRGRYHLAKRTKEDHQKALDYFRKAIKLDAGFAQVYVGISYLYFTGKRLGLKDENSELQSSALKAVELDPDLAEAQTALSIARLQEWKWVEAEQAGRKAIQLDPKSAEAHYFLGLLLGRIGRFDEALDQIKKAVELEPMSLIMNANLAGAYMDVGQNDLALIQARKTYDLDRNFASGRVWLINAYTRNKMYDEAVKLYEEAGKQEIDSLVMGRVYAAMGRRAEAEAIIEKVREEGFEAAQYWSARVYANLGEKDKAIAELEKAVAAKSDEAPRMRTDPEFAVLRGDPRFDDLVKQMKLPD
ncbi:MAG: tetratricopeptide repeat protein [Pyrinomonadaceae bacterium]